MPCARSLHARRESRKIEAGRGAEALISGARVEGRQRLADQGWTGRRPLGRDQAPRLQQGRDIMVWTSRPGRL